MFKEQETMLHGRFTHLLYNFKPKVTSSTPLGCPDGSLGRKTSATLMEIERNRQLLLAKQGEEEQV